MKLQHIILAGILLLTSLNGFSFVISDGNENNKTEKIFTSKDKDFLQQWHYDQILKMDLSEKERSAYFSNLNTYTYKMSKLGLPKFGYSNAERKLKFDELSDKLDALMKTTLSSKNYDIHQKTFDKIENIVYEKRNWEE